MPEPQTNHTRRPECIEEITRLDARVGGLEQHLVKLNGGLGDMAERLTALRLTVVEQIGEVERDLAGFRAHSEAFETEIRAYRQTREDRERESAKQYSQAAHQLQQQGDPITTALGLPLWKFLLLLVGLVVILGMGIEGGRWLMSRGGGIPSQGVTRPAPVKGSP